MKEKNSFEIPSAAEKLSHKFIFDALKAKDARAIPIVDESSFVETEAAVEAPPDALCGTPAEKAYPKGTQLELMPEPPLDPVPVTRKAIPQKPLKFPEGKKYFRIGEVSEIVGVEPYVLRYWESEFRTVRPEKTKTGQRVYARRDVEALGQIRHLLHVEKFSIKGAKQKLKEMKAAVAAGRGPQMPVERRNETLKQLISEVKELIKAAKTDPGI